LQNIFWSSDGYSGAESRFFPASSGIFLGDWVAQSSHRRPISAAFDLGATSA
jgi:hypothetical protein